MAEITDDQQPDEQYDFEGGGSSYNNPWKDRILSREMFYLGAKRGGEKDSMKKDGEARCFVVRRAHHTNIYAGVRFWLQVAIRDDLSVTGAPFYSSVRLNEGWTYQTPKKNPVTHQPVVDPRSGKVIMKTVIGLTYPPADKDILAKFVKEHPEMIAPKKFNKVVQYWADGNPKRDYGKLFCLEAYEVLFEYADVPNPASPGATKRVVVIDQTTKKPKYTINPTPFILEMNETWWEQYRTKIYYPELAQALEPKAADIDAVATTAPQKALPSKDKSQVVLKLFARTDEEDPSKARYIVDYSAALTIDSSAIVPVDELPSTPDGKIDWAQIYKPMTQEDVDKILTRAAAAKDPGLSDPPSHQDRVGAGAGSSSASGQQEPPPGDDDIPF